MIPLVLLVWGIVFSQLFSYFYSDPILATQEINQIINIDEIKEDTFSIVAAYRDPFLGRKTKSYRNNTSASAPQQSASRGGVKKSIPAEKPWPLMSYNGMIKNNNSDRKVGIVKINEKEYLVKSGDVIGEVSILTIEKKAIKVRFQKETKTITK